MVFAKINELAAAPQVRNTIPLKKKILLERLTRTVENLAPLAVLRRTERTIDEVILDWDIDGTQYYLVRCRPKAERKMSRISLSPRERAIAKLVAQGLPNKCIGNQLNISPWTVATHLRRIFAKLNVNSRTAMITHLLEENLLQD